MRNLCHRLCGLFLRNGYSLKLFWKSKHEKCAPKMPHVSYLEESTKTGKGWMLFCMAKKPAQSDADYSGAPDHTHRNLTNTRCAAAVAEVSRAGRTDSEVSPPHEHIEPSLETEHRAPSPIAGRTRNKTKQGLWVPKWQACRGGREMWSGKEWWFG